MILNNNHLGFAPIQIILAVLAGTIILGGIVGGVLYFTKSKLPEEQIQPKDKVQEQGYCGDGICQEVEKEHPDACPQDCTTQTRNNTSKNPTSIQDLKYSSVDSDAVKLDLYFPSKTCSNKLPLVVMIHGGAFKGGDKKPVRTAFLTDNCYAVASINYRLSDEAIFPAGNQDVKAAVRWLRANASKYNLDSEYFGAMGGSAGGYFSSFLGTTGDVKDFDVGDNLEYSSAVQAVVDEFGLVNITNLAQDRIDAGLIARNVESAYTGCDISSATCTKAKIASPSNYITRGDAPFFILHGAKDTQIPIKQSQDFYAKLLSAGVVASFVTLPNAGHGGPGFDTYELQILEFFNKYLKK